MGKKGIIALMCLAIAGGYLLCDCPAAAGQEALAEKAIQFKEGLAVSPVGNYRRSAVHSDLLEYQLVKGTLEEPKEGGVLGTSSRGREL